jgi:hypothetical protein
MLKWKILGVLGLAFGVGGMCWGYAQEKKAVGFFELRVYTAQPGKRDALAARFASRTAENTFIYMRGYPSKEERDKRLKAAHDDPEFGEVVTKQEQNPDTRLIVKAHNVDMTPSGTYTTITLTK